ncbi:MAG: NAD(P)/FAD-dependent oxidoreductase [Euryarchaeota archaeon]|nr:NAD(P)/FAD-dependent oxidoreductase [Euryarchaeota archaeon]
MKKDYYDLIIVGAGPAGLFAAHELKSAGREGQKKRVLVIEKGKDVEERHCFIEEVGYCQHCKECNIMCGVGGAGTWSDGTLNLRPDIGGDLAEFCDHATAWQLVEEVDRVFLKHGMPDELYNGTDEDIEKLKRRAASVGASFIEINQRHIGSDKTKAVIKAFKDDLVEHGIEFMLNTSVVDLLIEDGEKGTKVCTGVITDTGDTIKGGCTLLAPGRIGATWVDEMIKKHEIDAEYEDIDVGVRVEVPAITMNPVTRINRDPKFHIRTKRYDDFTRTFCTNEHGFVVKEEYDDFIGVNGHSMKAKKSENTNFAFLVRVGLTKPVENTTRYGRSIAKLATTIGGGKPILQRMGDLRRGRRSSWGSIKRNLVRNTLTDVTPGDISMALPHRITMDIIEGLEKLNEIIPGVASDSTLLYAPEIKFYAMRTKVDRNMETTVKNLFAAGDGTGLSRDIVNAAATGILAARGMLKTCG